MVSFVWRNPGASWRNPDLIGRTHAQLGFPSTSSVLASWTPAVVERIAPQNRMI
jgi:hypothetical protein